MTADEQYQSLVERQEALTRTVELLVREMHASKRPERENFATGEDGDGGTSTGSF